MAQRLETVSARRAHAAIVCCLVAGAAFAQADGKSALPRTPSGHPDLSGTYDVAKGQAQSDPDRLLETEAGATKKGAE